MKKNWLLMGAALVIAAALVLGACGKKDSGGSSGGGGSAAAQSGGKAKEALATDFKYELNSAGDGVVITGYQSDAAGGDLVIPAQIEGYPVVAMKLEYGHAFDEFYISSKGGYMTAEEVKAAGRRPEITSVVFPDSITEITYWNSQSIGGNALKSITFPKNLKEIPDGMANGLRNLTEITWPEALEQIGNNDVDNRGVFADTGFTELVIPEGVKVIGDRAFYGCENLTSVTIPGSVETIHSSAFASCPLLTTVNMPSKTIKYPYSNTLGAFEGCPKLTGIAIRKAIQDTGYSAEWF